MRLAGLRAWLLRLFGGRAAAPAEVEEPAPPDPRQAGLDLAAAGDPVGCLRFWRDADQYDVAEEKMRVQSQLLDELRRRLHAGPLEQADETAALIEEFSLSDLPGGASLLAHCRNIRLARLWQEDRLADIAAMAEQTDWLHPAALAIQAKVLCRLMAAEEPVALPLARLFISAWPTLLFHPAVGPQDAELRQALLDFGAECLRRQAALQPDSCAGLRKQWDNVCSILKSLRSLTAEPVYTPALAFRAGLAERHCALIKDGRVAFADETAWLAAGAAYSPAGQALLLLGEGLEEDALDALPDDEEDLFAAWGTAEVRVACCLRCLREGLFREAAQTAASGPAHWTDALERRLLGLLENEVLDSGQLAACADILALLPHDSGAAAAFCAALCAQATRLRCGDVSPRLLAAVTAKAAALSPGDEFAQLIHDQARLSLELAQIDEAFSCDCFAEAARIAAASRFPQVLEDFFTAARERAAKIERGDYPDREAAVCVLNELLRCACAVDGAHGAVRRIRQVLDSLRAAV